MVRRYITFGILAAILSITSQRCYYDNAEDLYPVITDTIDTTPAGPVSFAADIKPITDSRCAFSGCHAEGSTTRVPLTNYGEIKTAIESYELKEKVVDEKVMPKGSQLSATDYDKFAEWIADGYNDN